MPQFEKHGPKHTSERPRETATASQQSGHDAGIGNQKVNKQPRDVAVRGRRIPCQKPLIIQAAHGQIDGRSRQPARLVGGDESGHIRHLLNRHEPPRVRSARQHRLPLLPSHS